MGNFLNCLNKPREEPPVPREAPTVEEPPVTGSTPTVEKVEEPSASLSTPTLGEVIYSLKVVSDTTDLNEFVSIIKQLLERKKSDKGSTSESAKDNRRMWTLFVTSGAKFLEFVNGHTEKIEDMKYLHSTNSRVLAEILQQIGQVHWAVGGLAIAAYLIEKFEKVSANKTETLGLLSNMVDLATTVIKLREVIPAEEEKLKKAVMLVVQGSIMCISQIYSSNIFSFLKTSVNSENLKEMSKRLHHLYEDLNLAITTAIAMRQSKIAELQSTMAERQSEMAESQSEIAKRQSIVLPVPKPFYPNNAVGIENALEEVTKLLDITTEDESTLVVVIYGFGGIGKTTLANAVVAKLNSDSYNYVRIQLDEEKSKIAKLNSDSYNYVRIQLDEEKSKNDLKEMQKIILKDAFPTFHSEARLKLRDCQEGRDHLKEAFLCPDNKPVFLFIDNSLRSDDLKQLLPEDLSDLPKRTRIFLTTRKLDQTDVFLPLKRRPFAMKTLKKHHALEILCKDSDNRERNKDDIDRILRICGGVPLALKIVGAHLVKMEYNASKCTQILDALEKGEYVKEENLSQRVVHFVYNELEDGTKDAFLDICCFFSGNTRRHVEYVVGGEEVKSLEEAAFLTPFLDEEDINMGTIYSGEERLIVHDIVGATGRSMSASTRFRDVESFSEAAQDETKLSGIKGLWFGQSSCHYVISVNHLNSMRHSLRIMILGPNKRTSAQSRMKFKQLRYLAVDDDDVPHLPMILEELEMLGIYDGPMLPMYKLPKKLRMMVTSLPSQIETFATSSILNHSLEELYIHGGNIKQFPEGLNHLCSLKILVLLKYNELEEFPEQICELSSLIKLCIYDWGRLKHLPLSFGRLKRLTLLKISGCSELEELPSSFGQLTALDHLILQECPKLKQLPDGLESLKHLDVRGSEHLSMESYQNKSDLRILL